MKSLLFFFIAIVLISILACAWSLPFSREEEDAAKQLLFITRKVLKGEMVESGVAGEQHSLKAAPHNSTTSCRQAALTSERQTGLRKRVSRNEGGPSSAQTGLRKKVSKIEGWPSANVQPVKFDKLLSTQLFSEGRVVDHPLPYFNYKYKIDSEGDNITPMAESSQNLESPNVVYDHFLDHCFAPFYSSLTELLKLSQVFGINNPILDRGIKAITTIIDSVKRHDFSDEALKTFAGSIIKAFATPQLNFDANVSIVRAQLDWSELFKSLITKFGNGGPLQQYFKHLLVLARTKFTDNLTTKDAAALKEASDFFLDFFLQIPDSATDWSDEFKAAFKDTLKLVVPLYFKRASTKGGELSLEEKSRLLKSIVRLLAANAGDSSVLHFVDQLFPNDRNDQDNRKGLETALNYILNVLMDINLSGVEKFGLTGCLDSLRTLLSYIRDNLPLLLGGEEHADNTSGRKF